MKHGEEGSLVVRRTQVESNVSHSRLQKVNLGGINGRSLETWPNRSLNPMIVRVLPLFQREDSINIHLNRLSPKGM